MQDSKKSIAVAVSGGGDSLALLYLLSRWAEQHNGPRLHALTVDHGLRPDSQIEAKQVAAWVKNWPHVTHKILTWCGQKPKTKIAETARDKRYDLMIHYCHVHQMRHLFVAHHLNDQAETVLMRLSAGSALDGLSGMQLLQEREGVLLCRPLLNIPHDRLLATLRAAGQDWVEDPTNQNLDHPRPRLRAAAEILEREGLTPDRLCVIAGRMARARAALDQMTDMAWARAQVSPRAVHMLRADWDALPSEIQVRFLTRALGHIAPRARAARLEQIEAAVLRPVIRQTLAGCLITRGTKWVKVTRE